MEDSSLETKVSKIPKISHKKTKVPKCQSATEQIARDTLGIRKGYAKVTKRSATSA